MYIFISFTLKESAPSTDSEREVLGAEGGSENSSRYEDALEELAT